MILNFGTLLLLENPILPRSLTFRFSALAMLLLLPEMSCKRQAGSRVDRVCGRVSQRVRKSNVNSIM